MGVTPRLPSATAIATLMTPATYPRRHAPRRGTR